MKIAVRSLAFLAILALTLPIAAQDYLIWSRPRPAGGAPNDWSSSFDAIYDCEDSGNLGDNTGACSGTPSDCDLSVNGGSGATQDTTNYVVGSASCNFALDGDYIRSGKFGSPDFVPLNFAADISMGGWFRCSDCETDNSVLATQGNDAQLTFQSGGADECRAFIGANSDTPGSCHANNTWTFFAFTYSEGVGNPITVYSDGAQNCDGACDTVDSWAGSSDFERWDLGLSLSGQADETWVIGGTVLTAEQICRICSCNIDGSNCTCNGTSYTDSGRNTTSCGSCSLPDCNAAAP